MEWRSHVRKFDLTRPLVMGIVNVTPDSFSDGGRDTEAAVGHALKLIDDGADILDIGGESTRPGAQPVPPDVELRRVIPVIERLVARIQIPISVDTSKPLVARAAVAAGAEIINDVAGLRDTGMVEVVRSTGAACIVMHMQGTPVTMQDDPKYDDVVAEVRSYFLDRFQSLSRDGVAPERIMFDPGIGFGKRSHHNWQLIAGLSQLSGCGRPLCLGVSRKGFLGKDRAPKGRMVAGIAVALHGIARNSVQVIRTHDVRETRDAVDAWYQIEANQ
ncbi:MAG: dihydropteroate synthase [Gemmataceae bacterium]|nr:dihydropteroate synthase [Gemmataceae bacterium]